MNIETLSFTETSDWLRNLGSTNVLRIHASNHELAFKDMANDIHLELLKWSTITKIVCYHSKQGNPDWALECAYRTVEYFILDETAMMKLIMFPPAVLEDNCKITQKSAAYFLKEIDQRPTRSTVPMY